jgi:hypothetical protein
VGLNTNLRKIVNGGNLILALLTWGHCNWRLNEGSLKSEIKRGLYCIRQNVKQTGLLNCFVCCCALAMKSLLFNVSCKKVTETCHLLITLPYFVNKILTSLSLRKGRRSSYSLCPSPFQLLNLFTYFYKIWYEPFIFIFHLNVMLFNLQPRVWFPMRSFDFSVDLILPAALWPWSRLSL